ncbi:MAG: ABC transporter substrate-binding protein [Roseitalea sp.]|nr:putative urea ABC transporter substrate-binding protein [Oceaniradius stylonematis]MBO6552059.1 ABC transporter substrate-binding protein [Roseitalea sp.]MBO6951561.1 ABC transporter substrate-binding protein [Rhizobiaceae bacterium]MBO6592593.1 ABC transporter substrate-binding protein [Roseitalea sp.]MBO6598848.1 ABC transporter substrate-binding protein [Roseitalea sp.]MBO6611294.1 ABC transporter substrate-binding protein [Roseitalea sp.]
MIKTLKAAAWASAAMLALAVGQPANAMEKTEFSVCWSIYVGWMPWGYLEESGIMDKWADKYGIDVEIVQINDYVESINQYTAGQYDGCSMTNMDALSIPAGGGVDTTALIVGDFSNGNDGIVLKEGDSVEALAGQNVNLVELSVSHYLLARALDGAGLSERDLTVVNTSDADMIAAYATDDVTAVVTWNPLLSEIEATPGSTKVFDSSNIPGEIIDIMMVNTETLAANPDFGKALTGAWYEVMGLMAAGDEAALTAMADASGTDLAGYNAQLATTKMFYEPAAAVEFTQSPELPQTMQFVAEFLFDKGILGEGAPSPEFVGVEFPDGSVFGDEGNVKLRFDTSYMEMAANGEL